MKRAKLVENVHAVKYNYGQAMIARLIEDGLIVGVKCGAGYVIARYGVNLTTLKKIAKRDFS